MIENIYRVDVPILGGVDVLFQIQTRNDLDCEFGRDFIAATSKSFNAQTDGYNGSMFADFLDWDDAVEADLAMTKLATLYVTKVKAALAQEEAEFDADES